MNWIKVKTRDTESVLINTTAIMKIEYHKDTDLTVIDFIRAAYPSVYIDGNISTDIQLALTNKGDSVIRLGDK